MQNSKENLPISTAKCCSSVTMSGKLSPVVPAENAEIKVSACSVLLLRLDDLKGNSSNIDTIVDTTCTATNTPREVLLNVKSHPNVSSLQVSACHVPLLRLDDLNVNSSNIDTKVDTTCTAANTPREVLLNVKSHPNVSSLQVSACHVPLLRLDDLNVNSSNIDTKVDTTCTAANTPREVLLNVKSHANVSSLQVSACHVPLLRLDDLNVNSSNIDTKVDTTCTATNTPREVLLNVKSHPNVSSLQVSACHVPLLRLDDLNVNSSNIDTKVDTTCTATNTPREVFLNVKSHPNVSSLKVSACHVPLLRLDDLNVNSSNIDTKVDTTCTAANTPREVLLNVKSHPNVSSLQVSACHVPLLRLDDLNVNSSNIDTKVDTTCTATNTPRRVLLNVKSHPNVSSLQVSACHVPLLRLDDLNVNSSNIDTKVDTTCTAANTPREVLLNVKSHPNVSSLQVSACHVPLLRLDDLNVNSSNIDTKVDTTCTAANTPREVLLNVKSHANVSSLQLQQNRQHNLQNSMEANLKSLKINPTDIQHTDQDERQLTHNKDIPLVNSSTKESTLTITSLQITSSSSRSSTNSETIENGSFSRPCTNSNGSDSKKSAQVQQSSPAAKETRNDVPKIKQEAENDSIEDSIISNKKIVKTINGDITKKPAHVQQSSPAAKETRNDVPKIKQEAENDSIEDSIISNKKIVKTINGDITKKPAHVQQSSPAAKETRNDVPKIKQEAENDSIEDSIISNKKIVKTINGDITKKPAHVQQSSPAAKETRNDVPKIKREAENDSIEDSIISNKKIVKTINGDITKKPAHVQQSSPAAKETRNDVPKIKQEAENDSIEDSIISNKKIVKTINGDITKKPAHVQQSSPAAKETRNDVPKIKREAENNSIEDGMISNKKIVKTINGAMIKKEDGYIKTTSQPSKDTITDTETVSDSLPSTKKNNIREEKSTDNTTKSSIKENFGDHSKNNAEESVGDAHGADLDSRDEWERSESTSLSSVKENKYVKGRNRRSLKLTRVEKLIKGLMTKRDDDAIFTVKEVPGKGRSVFLKDTVLRKDSFVLEYKGDVISEDELNSRERMYTLNNECYFIMSFTYQGKKLIIDSTRQFDSLARLLNHSSKPNIRFHPPFLIDLRDGLLRIASYALKDIHMGEEIVFDYGVRDRDLPWQRIREIDFAADVDLDSSDDSACVSLDDNLLADSEVSENVSNLVPVSRDYDASCCASSDITSAEESAPTCVNNNISVGNRMKNDIAMALGEFQWCFTKAIPGGKSYFASSDTIGAPKKIWGYIEEETFYKKKQRLNAESIICISASSSVRDKISEQTSET